MNSTDHIGQEFFRLEMATAVAGAILGINPFDQPDVEAAKIKTRELTATFEKTGKLPDEEPVVSTAEADIYTDAANADALRKASADGDLSSWLKAHFSRTEARRLRRAARLSRARRRAYRQSSRGTRLPFGTGNGSPPAPSSARASCIQPGRPTKAAPTAAIFLQITADDATDLKIPGQKTSFSVIKAAQARGDFDVLTGRGRRALHVHLKGDLESGLGRLGRCDHTRLELIPIPSSSCADDRRPDLLTQTR